MLYKHKINNTIKEIVLHFVETNDKLSLIIIKFFFSCLFFFTIIIHSNYTIIYIYVGI